MHPIICQFGPFTVYSYGLALVVSFLAASYLAQKQALRCGLDPQAVFNLLFISFICGVIGSRLFYVIENFGYYLGNPLEMVMFQHGGLSWFGGIFLGCLSALCYLKIKKLPIYKTLDLLIPFVALGQAIGRIGCFLNGCCYGKPSIPHGVYFPGLDAQLIPTQIYSSAAMFLIFLFLKRQLERPHRDGQVLFTYFLLYSIKRFTIEFWRADNPVLAYGLTLFQYISIIVFAAALWQLVSAGRKK
ncbi:MAG: prolipoprotein diacylglyceryl transferase [Candidatus Omnitrophota bacterium]|jgi:phosphatidylglycerol:prolipoprotein diacylglycerol transferase